MGFSVYKSCGFLPASFENGCLRIKGFASISNIQFKGLSSLYIEEQINFFSSPYIRCLLRNDDYEFILRYDGTYNVYKRKTGKLALNGNRISNIDNNIYSQITTGLLGLLRTDKGIVDTMYYSHLDNQFILYANDIPITCILDKEKEVTIIARILSKKSYDNIGREPFYYDESNNKLCFLDTDRIVNGNLYFGYKEVIN